MKKMNNNTTQNIIYSFSCYSFTTDSTKLVSMMFGLFFTCVPMISLLFLKSDCNDGSIQAYKMRQALSGNFSTNYSIDIKP